MAAAARACDLRKLKRSWKRAQSRKKKQAADGGDAVRLLQDASCRLVLARDYALCRTLATICGAEKDYYAGLWWQSIPVGERVRPDFLPTTSTTEAELPSLERLAIEAYLLERIFHIGLLMHQASSISCRPMKDIDRGW